MGLKNTEIRRIKIIFSENWAAAPLAINSSLGVFCEISTLFPSSLNSGNTMAPS